MTNRRSFFKRLGLAATAITVTGKVEATPAPPPPPTPKVRSKAAYVTTVSGHESVIVKHGLDSLIVCAMAGDSSGKALPAVVEVWDRNACVIRVPKPQRGLSLFNWRGKPTNQLYSLIVYVPM